MNNYQLSVKKYSVYKDSGVEWLGDVPEHWELRRLKDISQITRGAILRPVDDPSYFDKNGEWYYLNISDVTKCDKFLYTAKLKLSELGSRKSARVLPNNIILTASATIGKPTINKVKVCVHDGFIPFKQIQCNIIYLYYFLLNSSIYNALGKSNTQKNIYLDEVKTVNIAVPSQAEQESIATYLDTKTAQCDRKIDLLTQKATQYGNLKHSLINETVTRGLDKSVPMKDSGVEWIGDVPEHWEHRRIKDFTDSSTVVKVPSYLNDDDLIEFIPMTNVDEKLGRIKEFNLVPLKEVSSGYTKFKNGDVIFAKITPCMENGNAALVSELRHNIGFGSTEFMVFRPLRKLTAKYLHYFLHSDLFRKNAEPFMKGTAGQKRITSLYMTTHYLACPPLSEQKAIADYLDKKTAQIDQIIQTINTQIEKLKELRKTLINDVVTGKIRV